MPPKNGAERVKASRIRKKRALEPELVDADEAAFLDDYEDVEGGPLDASGPVDASASTERVVHIEERKAAAQGSHLHPDAYAAVATATGLRADTLLRICTTALVEANNQYRLMTEHLLARTTQIESAHVAMLETVRENYLARIEAEAENRMLAAAGGGEGEMGELLELLKFGLAAREHHQATTKGKKKPAKKSGRPLGAL
jgi:hypothetical protein